MTLRKWERQEHFVETMRRLHRGPVADVAQRLRQMRGARLSRPRSARTEEASARITRRLMAPQ